MRAEYEAKRVHTHTLSLSLLLLFSLWSTDPALQQDEAMPRNNKMPRSRLKSFHRPLEVAISVRYVYSSYCRTYIKAWTLDRDFGG